MGHAVPSVRLSCDGGDLYTKFGIPFDVLLFGKGSHGV